MPCFDALDAAHAAALMLMRAFALCYATPPLMPLFDARCYAFQRRAAALPMLDVFKSARWRCAPIFDSAMFRYAATKDMPRYDMPPLLFSSLLPRHARPMFMTLDEDATLDDAAAACALPRCLPCASFAFTRR